MNSFRFSFLLPKIASFGSKDEFIFSLLLSHVLKRIFGQKLLPAPSKQWNLLKTNLSDKHRRRLGQAAASILANFATPAISVALSVVVVRVQSDVYWGAYVRQLILVTLMLTIVNWGSKEFLLRKYSDSPGAISSWLWASVYGRFFLAGLLLLPLVPLAAGLEFGWQLLLWIPVRMSWQCFESLNIYRRLFVPVALLEILLSGSLIVLTLYFLPGLDVFLRLVILADLIKAFSYALLNRAYLMKKPKTIPFRSFLKESAPFLALALAGLLASRAELYLLSFLQDSAILARYQVLSNFIQYAHLFAAAVMLPFLKNLYRVDPAVFDRLERRVIRAGLPVSAVLTGVIFAISTFLYQFHFTYPAFILVYLNIWGFYWYFMRIQANFRDRKLPQTILIVSLMGLANAICGWILIPDAGLLGALAANLSATILGILCFRINSRT